MPYPSKTDRKKILATALSQIEKEGLDKLAIRSVAAALSLAPNALYRYFASLAELEAALADESLSRLLKAMERAAEKKPPEEAIRGLSFAYVRFAREHRELFALILRPGLREGDEDAMHAQCWRFVLGQVSRIYSEKHVPEAAVALWALLHGMTALETAGVMGQGKPLSGLAFGLNTWIKAAKAEKDPGT